MNNYQVKYRYPGVQPFTAQQKQIFFGRTKDINNLYELLSLEKMVILYSKSGLGKSSLINAGIIPKFKIASNFETYSIRFGAYTKEQHNTPVSITSRQLLLNKYDNTYLDKLLPEDNSFWYFVKREQEKTKNEKKILLVFDQFEELFTYPKHEIIKFKKELKEILSTQIPQRFRDVLEKQFENNRLELTEKELELFHREIEIKVLIAIRSDRISLLNDLKDYLPNILRHCYELQALSVEQAEDAILNPALKKESEFISPTFDFEDEGLDAILQFLTKNYTQKIESFQLQILCQNIEKKVIERNLQKVAIADIGDIEKVYNNHYNNLIENIGNKDEQLAVRRLIEEGLIFEEDKRRISLYEGQIYKNFSISPELLIKLLDTHLIRSEPSPLGGYAYELSHDTLISAILSSKSLRVEAILKEKIKLEQQKRIIELQSERRKFRNAIILAIIGFSLAIFAFYALSYAKRASKEATIAQNLAKDALEKFKLAEYNKYINLGQSLKNNQSHDDAIEAYQAAWKYTNDSIEVNELINEVNELIELLEVYNDAIKKAQNSYRLGVEKWCDALSYYQVAMKTGYNNELIEKDVNAITKEISLKLNEYRNRLSIARERGYQSKELEYLRKINALTCK